MGWQSIQIVGAGACVIFILLQKIFLVPAHPGCPGQNLQSHKMVVLCVRMLYAAMALSVSGRIVIYYVTFWFVEDVRFAHYGQA